MYLHGVFVDADVVAGTSHERTSVRVLPADDRLRVAISKPGRHDLFDVHARYLSTETSAATNYK